MTDSAPGTDDRLAALRARFVARAIEQRAGIAALRDQLAAKTAPAEAFVELRHLCHSLHGAAGTFGFGEISQAADRAETICDEIVARLADGKLEPSAELDAALENLAGLLDRLG